MRQTETQLRRFIRIYYTIGALGFIIPFTAPYFEYMTPWGLVLNVIIALYLENKFQNREKNSLKFFLFIAGVYLLTFLIEMAGVNTGLLFGKYIYGETLGIKVAGTPLIIGVNWIVVFLGASELTGQIKGTGNRIVLTAAIMTGFDLLLEQVAPTMGMWCFEGGIVPLKNYITWFIISLLLSGVRELLSIHIQSGINRLILICQCLFFAAIYVARIIIQSL